MTILVVINQIQGNIWQSIKEVLVGTTTVHNTTVEVDATVVVRQKDLMS